jgi:protein TonB
VRLLPVASAILLVAACATPPPRLSSLPSRPGAIYSPAECCGPPIVYKEPPYPANAINRRQTGWVVVSGILDSDGRVREARVLAAEPQGVFEKAALEAFEQWRYSPPPSTSPEKQEVRVVLRFRTR